VRVDENNNSYPSTLFEYRALCLAIGGPDCAAVKSLDEKIAQHGGLDDEVIASDHQMRMLLMPMLKPPA
jgi:hypothetical protein